METELLLLGPLQTARSSCLTTGSLLGGLRPGLDGSVANGSIYPLADKTLSCLFRGSAKKPGPN